jgi:hypothetical protein
MLPLTWMIWSDRIEPSLRPRMIASRSSREPTTKSGLPSPLKSPTPTETGLFPVPKLPFSEMKPPGPVAWPLT